MSCSNCQLNNSTNLSNRTDMLTSYDWLSDLPDTSHISDIVEVRFKGTRKEFYKNSNKIKLTRGDMVVVATSGGHDVGIVSLTGKLAQKQFDIKVKFKERHQWHIIYRNASERDIEYWEEAKSREKPVMIQARQIAEQIGLDMKIGDVEFRGDGHKAIFYYIANGRVDFRQLIKEYAREFRIKVEMKQIGARQEAARVGGIGSCGRELCCSSWRTDFTSISAFSASKQGLSPNAEKLAGRCGKLKCCLMYELDNYLEAREDFPTELLTLETSSGIASHIKTDILLKKITYKLDNAKSRQTIVLSVDSVKEVIQLNKRGIKPDISQYSESESVSESEEKNMFNKNLIQEKKPALLKNKHRNKKTGRNVRDKYAGSHQK